MSLTITFFLGFGYKSITKKVILNEKRNWNWVCFSECKDPKKRAESYQKHMDLDINPCGASFDWYKVTDSIKKLKHNELLFQKLQNTLSLLPGIL